MSDPAHSVSATSFAEQWHATHNEVVERVFKKRLRQFPDHVRDGIQGFWLDFVEKRQWERFDSALCPSEAGYVGVLAKRYAVNLFLELVKGLRNVPIEESEPPQPKARPQAASDDANEYLLQLVSTNRLKPTEALVFICKAWISIGPVELAQKYWHSTLFELCDLVAARLEGQNEDLEVPRKLLKILHEQLTLPSGHALGEQRLAELLQNKRDSTSWHCASEDGLQRFLFDLLEQAKRVCVKGSKGASESTTEFIKRAVALLLKTLRSRFGFLIELARDVLRPIDPEKVLAWGWEKLLNIAVEIYGQLSCASGSGWLLRRMAFMLPDFPIPNGLVQSLSGRKPEETILNRLRQLETDSIHAVRAVEARYQRALPVQG